MNSMIYETASRLDSTARLAKTAVEILFYAACECALGLALVARGVADVRTNVSGGNDDELEADLAARFPPAKLAVDEAAAHDDLVKVIRLVERPAEGLDLTLDMGGTQFQRRVWEKLRVAFLTSGRPVAGACVADPIALAIPCHHIVRRNRDVAGYRWGIERKHELIGKEAMA
jgi:AraC family transcriptional regulator, regulatory protein of adaptative response / methylated-DNA-[protein]-cysteine methyltransferase